LTGLSRSHSQVSSSYRTSSIRSRPKLGRRTRPITIHTRRLDHTRKTIKIAIETYEKKVT
jgi:hypothetical protein